MNAFATIAARLQVLEALEAENVELRAFVENVAGVYEIADIQELIHDACRLARGWA